MSSEEAGEPASRRVRLDTSDPLYGDVQPDPALGRTPSQAPVSRSGPSAVQWPDLDVDDAYAGRPDWQQWRQLQDDASADARAADKRRESGTAPAAPDRQSAVPTVSAPFPTSRPPRTTQPTGRRRRFPLVPVLLSLVVGANIMISANNHQPISPYLGGSFDSGQQVEPKSGLQALHKVAPEGVSVPAVTDPKTVRLELLGAEGTTANIRYQGDVGAATTLETVALPWAVEAPLSTGNRHVQLTANDTKRSTDPMNQGTMLCRIYLDGVVVEQTVGNGYAECASSVDRFRDPVPQGSGQPLAAAHSVAASTDGVPTVPASPRSVSFEAYSSALPGKVQIGTFGEPDVVDTDSVELPAAWQGRFPTSTDLMQATVSGSSPGSGVRLMCRVLVDDVLVQESVSTISATCNLSPYFLLGRSH